MTGTCWRKASTASSFCRSDSAPEKVTKAMPASPSSCCKCCKVRWKLAKISTLSPRLCPSSSSSFWSLADRPMPCAAATIAAAWGSPPATFSNVRARARGWLPEADSRALSCFRPKGGRSTVSTGRRLLALARQGAGRPSTARPLRSQRKAGASWSPHPAHHRRPRRPFRTRPAGPCAAGDTRSAGGTKPLRRHAAGPSRSARSGAEGRSAPGSAYCGP